MESFLSPQPQNTGKDEATDVSGSSIIVSSRVPELHSFIRQCKLYTFSRSDHIKSKSGIVIESTSIRYEIHRDYELIRNIYFTDFMNVGKIELLANGNTVWTLEEGENCFPFWNNKRSFCPFYLLPNAKMELRIIAKIPTFMFSCVLNWDDCYPADTEDILNITCSNPMYEKFTHNGVDKMILYKDGNMTIENLSELEKLTIRLDDNFTLYMKSTTDISVPVFDKEILTIATDKDLVEYYHKVKPDHDVIKSKEYPPGKEFFIAKDKYEEFIKLLSKKYPTSLSANPMQVETVDREKTLDERRKNTQKMIEFHQRALDLPKSYLKEEELSKVNEEMRTCMAVRRKVTEDKLRIYKYLYNSGI